MTAKTVFARDTFQLSERSMSPEGYLIAPAKIARSGVQEYYAYELGLDKLDPLKLIKLDRPTEEVFNQDSMKSFESKPITIEHPEEGVTAENWRELSNGEATKVQRDGDFMSSTLIVKSKEGIQAIEDGKSELSNGYSFILDMTPGTNAKGEKYDGVQRATSEAIT